MTIFLHQQFSQRNNRLQFVLGMRSDSIDPRLRSGGALLERPLSSASQDYDTDRNVWPINKPVPKLEAIYQTSGEAEYIADIITGKEVFCAFVVADIHRGKIKDIDASKALVSGPALSAKTDVLEIERCSNDISNCSMVSDTIDV